MRAITAANRDKPFAHRYSARKGGYDLHQLALWNAWVVYRLWRTNHFEQPDEYSNEVTDQLIESGQNLSMMPAVHHFWTGSRPSISLIIAQTDQIGWFKHWMMAQLLQIAIASRTTKVDDQHPLRLLAHEHHVETKSTLNAKRQSHESAWVGEHCCRSTSREGAEWMLTGNCRHSTNGSDGQAASPKERTKRLEMLIVPVAAVQIRERSMLWLFNASLHGIARNDFEWRELLEFSVHIAVQSMPECHTDVGHFVRVARLTRFVIKYPLIAWWLLALLMQFSFANLHQRQIQPCASRWWNCADEGQQTFCESGAHQWGDECDRSLDR